MNRHRRAEPTSGRPAWHYVALAAGVLILTGLVVLVALRPHGKPAHVVTRTMGEPGQRTPPAGVPTVAQAVEVVRIVDGDTVDVKAERPGEQLEPTTAVRVRLLNIDTPETLDPAAKVQCFGAAAAAETGRLLTVGSTAYVMADEKRRDRYGRYLLDVWNEEGSFVNEQLVAGGLAYKWLYDVDNIARYPRIKAAEAKAKQAGLGVWSDPRGPQASAWRGCTAPKPHPEPTFKPSPGSSPYYRTCDEVRRMYNGQLKRGEPGYRPQLDRNKDGIACNS